MLRRAAEHFVETALLAGGVHIVPPQQGDDALAGPGTFGAERRINLAVFLDRRDLRSGRGLFGWLAFLAVLGLGKGGSADRDKTSAAVRAADANAEDLTSMMGIEPGRETEL
jgi:hypothetical protein